MAIPLKPGTRLLSSVDSTEMITVRAPAGELDITIGGYPPVTAGGERTGIGALPGHDGGAAMGKRYVDAADTIELICTKAGSGVPALDGAVLQVKEPKALPASD